MSEKFVNKVTKHLNEIEYTRNAMIQHMYITRLVTFTCEREEIIVL